jgi:hypothetical protein
MPSPNARLARWRVRRWLAIERHAERQLRHAYDRLVDIEAGRENSPGRDQGSP